MANKELGGTKSNDKFTLLKTIQQFKLSSTKPILTKGFDDTKLITAQLNIPHAPPITAKVFGGTETNDLLTEVE